MACRYDGGCGIYSLISSSSLGLLPRLVSTYFGCERSVDGSWRKFRNPFEGTGFYIDVFNKF